MTLGKACADVLRCIDELHHIDPEEAGTIENLILQHIAARSVSHMSDEVRAERLVQSTRIRDSVSGETVRRAG